jgi:hypothetical protein
MRRMANNDTARAHRAINIAWQTTTFAFGAKIIIVKQCMKKETPISNHQYVKKRLLSSLA